MIGSGKYKGCQSVFDHIQFFHPITQGHIYFILFVYQPQISIVVKGLSGKQLLGDYAETETSPRLAGNHQNLRKRFHCQIY
jgi:hypothetical protein